MAQELADPGVVRDLSAELARARAEQRAPPPSTLAGLAALAAVVDAALASRRAACDLCRAAPACDIAVYHRDERLQVASLALRQAAGLGGDGTRHDDWFRCPSCGAWWHYVIDWIPGDYTGDVEERLACLALGADVAALATRLANGLARYPDLLDEALADLAQKLALVARAGS
jgi:hypothetical protein